ncbi:MAG: hypothetical protein ACRDJ5_11065, partial [Actinomycetota bacterium]
IHALGTTVNRRLASAEPWHLDDAEARRELTCLLPYLDALGVAAYPIVPGTAGRIRALWGRAPAPGAWALEHAPPRFQARPRPPLEMPPRLSGGSRR